MLLLYDKTAYVAFQKYWLQFLCFELPPFIAVYTVVVYDAQSGI